jgi:Tol biopolymer transport system component
MKQMRRCMGVTFGFAVAICLAVISCLSVTPVTGAQAGRASIGYGYAGPSWSPMGDRLVFTYKGPQNDDIWIIDRDGSNPNNLTPDTPSNDMTPAWSPDGQSITFMSDRAGKWDLWIMGTDGSHPRNLTEGNKGYVVEHEWSPDGRYIAFVVLNLENRLTADIWVLNLEEMSTENLTSSIDRFCNRISWSPNSEVIAFAASDVDIFRRDGIWTATIGWALTMPLTPFRNDLDAAWSPNGRTLAITNQDRTDFDIWRLDTDGGKLTNLTADNPSFDISPAWSPDGGSLAIVSSRNNRQDIWLMDLADTHSVNLTGDMNGLSTNPVWSPDGKWIAFEFYPSAVAEAGVGAYADIWVMNADGSDKVNLTKNEPMPADNFPTVF